jgi:hypothetical protein
VSYLADLCCRAGPGGMASWAEPPHAACCVPVSRASPVSNDSTRLFWLPSFTAGVFWHQSIIPRLIADLLCGMSCLAWRHRRLWHQSNGQCRDGKKVTQLNDNQEYPPCAFCISLLVCVQHCLVRFYQTISLFFPS